jgi:hypothetical protein
VLVVRVRPDRLEQEAARREVEREVTDIDDGALAVLDVRPPSRG